MLKLIKISEKGDSSVQSESHKSDSEDIDGVDIDEELDEQPIIVDSEGPSPCKVANKELSLSGGKVPCDSSTDVDLEGDPLKEEPIRKAQSAPITRIRGTKRQICHIRKKMSLGTSPEGIEAVVTSSSHDEADVEDGPCRFPRKRRKVLRKTRNKNFKGKKNKRSVSIAGIEALSDGEADSEPEMKTVNVSLKEASTLMLPTQVNSLVEA